MLLDLKLKKLDFAKRAGISGATLAKLGGDKMVALDIIGKICIALSCTPNDILEFSDISNNEAMIEPQ
jgi:DNA-binding Xre family transcriptional regulator